MGDVVASFMMGMLRLASLNRLHGSVLGISLGFMM